MKYILDTNVDYLITGDADLLQIVSLGNTAILRPAEFLSVLSLSQ